MYKILEHQLYSCFLNSNISCFAEVLVAQVCLEQCELAIPEIYKKVPVLATAKLINQTLLPTVFEWGDVSSIYYTPANFVCGGCTVFTLSVRACVRPSVTLRFLNILKNHGWIFIKPCKHVHICKTNTLNKKVRARGQFY